MALAAFFLAAPLFAQQASPVPPLSGTSGSGTVETRVIPGAEASESSTSRSVVGNSGSESGKLEQTAFQPRSDGPRNISDSDKAAVQEITIQLDPPSFQRLTGKLESEKMLRRRFLQEAKNRGEPGGITFPDEPEIATGPYVGRNWPRMVCTAEPNYVGYNRLLFNQINLERYGWDLGAITPFVSAGLFFKDVLFLPYHLATDPFRLYEYNTGYCLPGDPVPLLLYPPEISFTGALAEMGAIVTLVAVFP